MGTGGDEREGTGAGRGPVYGLDALDGLSGFDSADDLDGLGGLDDRPFGRLEQAAAFDAIGDRYDEAFPTKQSQLDAGEWLAETLPTGSRVLDFGCGTGEPTARQLLRLDLLPGLDAKMAQQVLARRNLTFCRDRQRRHAMSS